MVGMEGNGWTRNEDGTIHVRGKSAGIQSDLLNKKKDARNAVAGGRKEFTPEQVSTSSPSALPDLVPRRKSCCNIFFLIGCYDACCSDQGGQENFSEEGSFERVDSQRDQVKLRLPSSLVLSYPHGNGTCIASPLLHVWLIQC